MILLSMCLVPQVEHHFIARQCSKKFGLFDERFFAYYEDVDIGFRAQLVGWKVWYEPGAVASSCVSN